MTLETGGAVGALMPARCTRFKTQNSELGTRTGCFFLFENIALHPGYPLLFTPEMKPRTAFLPSTEAGLWTIHRQFNTTMQWG